MMIVYFIHDVDGDWCSDDDDDANGNVMGSIVKSVSCIASNGNFTIFETKYDLALMKDMCNDTLYYPLCFAVDDTTVF